MLYLLEAMAVVYWIAVIFAAIVLVLTLGQVIFSD